MKSDSKMKLQIEREIKIMSSLDHKNVIRINLIGIPAYHKLCNSY